MINTLLNVMKDSVMGVGGWFGRTAWLLLVSSALAGVQFVYSVQFAAVVPLFIRTTKLRPSIAGLIAATAGPICGLIVQPIVGAFSDHARFRLGRRRPYIAMGSLFCAIGLLLIAFAQPIGAKFGDNVWGETWRDHRVAIGLAVAGLWLALIFANVAHAPSRAIVIDVSDQARQHEANAMANASQAFAAIVANSIGALLFLMANPYPWLFAAAAIAIVVLMMPTLFSARESADYAAQPRPPILAVMRRIATGFGSMTPRARGALLVFFLSWAAFAPYLVFITVFWGNEVFGPHGNVDRGVQRGLYGLAIMAATQYIASFALAPTINRIGVRKTYTALQLLATAIFVLFYYIPRWHGAARQINSTAAMSGETFALMALLGIHYAAVNAIPYAIVAEEEKGDEAGLAMGLLNSGCVIAQVSSNLFASWLIHRHEQDVSIGIAFGAFPSLICSLVAPLALPGGSRGKRIQPPTFGSALGGADTASQSLLPGRLR